MQDINTYVVVRSTTNGATFAFDTLPPVLANRNDHVCSELQTSWMPYNKNVRTSWIYTVFGMERGICRGMRVERCRDIYLVPKNSELQAIVFFSFFRQIAFIFLCVIKSQIELHKQEQERKIMYNV